MSLISDALNEAQREANKRRKESQPALLGDNPLLTPPAVVVAPPYRPWTRVVIIASIVVLVLASAVGTGVWTYRKLTSHPDVAAAVDGASSAPAQPAPVIDTTKSVVASASTSATAGRPNQREPDTRSGSRATVPAPAASPPPATAPSRRTVASSGSQAIVPPPTSSRRLPVSRAPTRSIPREASPASAITPTIATATARARDSGVSAPPPTRAPQQDIRVIVDPTVLRPGDSLFLRAYTEHTRGNLDAAADLYERALTQPPVSPELYNDYGALLATRGKHTAAIAMYNLGIARNDKDARLWANLGDSYRATGRRADAMSAYFEAVKLDPANVGVRLRLAGEYALLGDTASARRGFEEAVRSAPNDAEAHYRYGAFLQSQRDVSGAIRELQTFVDLAPGKYPADVVDRTKAYIANLRRVNR